MLLLDAENTAEYLRQTGRIGAEETVRVEVLSGGVSNQVVLVARTEGPDFVVKQSRAQLRVAAEWFSRLDRVWREVITLRWCQQLLADSSAEPLAAKTPEILFEDGEQYLFAMTAAPRPHTTWKQQLLSRETDASVAMACGQLLGRLHAASWEHPGVAASLDDRGVFDELRLDPYYRATAAVHGELKVEFASLIDSVWRNRYALTHADFSPKNLLVHAGGLTMIDFETGHFGDPAFDLGFFLSHLVLKFVHFGNIAYLRLGDAFWETYRTARQKGRGFTPTAFAALEARAMQNLAGCLLARIDGKSPVEYLTSPDQKETVRNISRQLFCEKPNRWEEAGFYRNSDQDP